MSSSGIAIVLLHGSGDEGRSLRYYLENMPMRQGSYHNFGSLLRSKGITLVTPSARRRPYTYLGGAPSTVWFDRSRDFGRLGLDDTEDTAGVDSSFQSLSTELSSVFAAHPHVFFGGFSMGGGLALHAARKDLCSDPRHRGSLRGVFSMGSFLVNESAVFSQPLSAGGSLFPFLLMHGEEDGVIPVQWGRQTATNLTLREVDVQFRTYPDLNHEIGEDQLRDLMAWIEDIVRRTNLSRQAEEKKSADFTSEKGDSPDSKDGKAQEEAKAEARDLLREATTAEHKGPAGDAMPYQYRLEFDPLTPYSQGPPRTSAAPRATIHYSVPSHLVNVLVSRPVLACGAIFEILPDPPEGVKTAITSADPHKTANEIGLRLINRVNRGTSSLSPCPVS